MDVDTGPTWSDIAAWYDELVERGSGPHETALRCLLELVPAGPAGTAGTAGAAEAAGAAEPLAEASVLDLACGTGLATRALVAHGAARVVGVDASPEMIELARGHGAAGGPAGRPTYVVDDAQVLASFDDGTFDGVTCQLGLMDIPDLDRTLAAVHRVLRPGGWFVFVIGHPCFLAPEARPATVAIDGGDRPAVTITGYFHERFWRSSNPQGVRRAGNHHRTLSTYLNAAIAAGFAIAAVAEPPASPLLAEHNPLYAEVPLLFAARLSR